jgi:hypothetical protein
MFRNHDFVFFYHLALNHFRRFPPASNPRSLERALAYLNSRVEVL